MKKRRKILNRVNRKKSVVGRATGQKPIQALAQGDVYDRFLAMRGKVRFSIDLDELREDRD